jgi:hypothetical protein
MRLSAAALALVAVVPGCRRAPAAAADPAVLLAAMWYWQEGPTDGRVCLEPRALAAPDAAGPAPRWADSVLAALLADTLVALDTTSGAAGAGCRACAPEPSHPRVTFGVPRVRGDTADLEMAAYAPAAGARPPRADRFPTVLSRRAGQWYFVGRADHRVQELPAPPGA